MDKKSMLMFSGIQNQFIKLSSTTLGRAIKLEFSKEVNSMNCFKNIQIEFLEEINKITFKLKHLKFDSITIHAFLYCLCSFLDETIMNLSHEHMHEWSKISLLSSLFKETWGGENFYSIVNYMKKDAQKYIELIEFTYLLNSLGYKGKFYHKSNLVNPLNEIHEVRENKVLNKNDYHFREISEQNPYLENHKKSILIFICLLFFTTIIFTTYYNNELNKYKKYYSKFIKEKIHECEKIYS